MTRRNVSHSMVIAALVLTTIEEPIWGPILAVMVMGVAFFMLQSTKGE